MVCHDLSTAPQRPLKDIWNDLQRFFKYSLKGNWHRLKTVEMQCKKTFKRRFDGIKTTPLQTLQMSLTTFAVLLIFLSLCLRFVFLYAKH